ncbi:AMP-binding protein, partial [Kibdelosporangium lantanae]
MLDNALFGMGENVPADWNRTAVSIRPQIFSQIYEEQVRRTPRLTAVRHARQDITYAELDARANRLAHLLVSRGAGAERIVALRMP